MRKRIVHIIPTLDQGGAEKQLAMLATHLPADAFDVQVVVLTRTGPWEDELNRSNIPVHLIGKRGKVDVRAYRRLKAKLRELKPDLVQTWLFAANTYGRKAAWSVGCRKIVASERCVDLWKSWYHFAFDRRLAKKTNRIVANSNAVKEFYASKGIDEHRIVVIPNGIEVPQDSVSTLDSPLNKGTDALEGDQSTTETTGQDQQVGPLLQRTVKESVRAELNLAEDVKLIAAVGRLWPQKRFRDLIWAADLLKCIRNDVHLLIIGDGPERAGLMKYAEQVEIADKVHFLGHRADAVNLIGQVDVLWSGSEYEGLSNVIMEAMAVRVPVIATKIRANEDLIEHDQTGVLVPVGDRASFAKWATFLLDHPEKATSLADAARTRIENEFSNSMMIDRYIELYREILR